MDLDFMTIDLDKALHHLLSRQNFTGPGQAVSQVQLRVRSGGTARIGYAA
jgi:hypothetical protein